MKIYVFILQLQIAIMWSALWYVATELEKEQVDLIQDEAKLWKANDQIVKDQENLYRLIVESKK